MTGTELTVPVVVVVVVVGGVVVVVVGGGGGVVVGGDGVDDHDDFVDVEVQGGRGERRMEKNYIEPGTQGLRRHGGVARGDDADAHGCLLGW